MINTDINQLLGMNIADLDSSDKHEWVKSLSERKLSEAQTIVFKAKLYKVMSNNQKRLGNLLEELKEHPSTYATKALAIECLIMDRIKYVQDDFSYTKLEAIAQMKVREADYEWTSVSTEHTFAELSKEHPDSEISPSVRYILDVPLDYLINIYNLSVIAFLTQED